MPAPEPAPAPPPSPAVPSLSGGGEGAHARALVTNRWKLRALSISLPTVPGRVAGTPVSVIFDTGATKSYISKDLATRLKLKVLPNVCAERQVELADGKTLMDVLGTVTVPLQMHRYSEVLALHVLDMKGLDIVLGLSWQQPRRAVIRTYPFQVVFQRFGRGGCQTAECILTPDSPCPDPSVAATRRSLMNRRQVDEAVRSGKTAFLVFVREKPKEAPTEPAPEPEPPPEWSPEPPSDLPSDVCMSEAEGEPMVPRTVLPESFDVAPRPEHKDPVVTALLGKFSDVFPKALTSPPPKRSVDHEIIIDEMVAPPFRRPYRLSDVHRRELARQVEILLRQGFITPSSSPFGAPVLFVPKPDGSWRMCIDYRALNTITRKNKFPLPRIDDLFDRLHGAAYFTSIDLTQGYYQVLVREEDRPKTAFQTHLGAYEFVVMPFGLCNAPATFQRIMHDVFRPYLDKFVLVYLDDLLIFSRTREEHLEHLELVLQLLRKHKLYARLSKCSFMQTEVKYLGFRVSAAGARPDPAGVEKVQQWPTPDGIPALRRFLGVANHYRKFIPHFAQLAMPMTRLLRKDASWNWDDACDHAFDELKRRLTAAPCLIFPDPSLPYRVTVDASGGALGAVLEQDQGRGMQPIAFASRRLADPETRYPTYEQELLAIVHALRIWEHYLLGAQHVVHLCTDHQPLQHLFSQRKLSGRLARWVEEFAQFDLKVEYVPGSQNVVADALSRLFAVQTGVSELQPDDSFLGRFRTACQRDPAYQQWLGQAAEGLLPAHHVHQGLLYRRGREEADPPRLVVPDDLEIRRILIAEAHDPPASGHLGAHKTYARLRQLFWWNHMPNSVREYVTTCPACQCNKAQHELPAGLLKPLDVPEGPWLSVSLDLITGLPSTPSGFDAIAVFVCRLTKMMVAVPTTKTVDAPGMAQLFLQHVYAIHGLPVELVSDRDPRFTSDFWRALFKLLGSRLALSSPYHPQTDGQTERANRTLEEMLRAFVNTEQTDWDSLLPVVTMAYNSTPHAGSRFSPFFLVHGREPRLPLSLLSPRKPDSSVEAVSDRVNRWRKAVILARQRLVQAQRRMSRNADKRRRALSFTVGEKVLLDAKDLHLPVNRSKKLSPRYIGPLRVVQILADGAAAAVQLPEVLQRAGRTTAVFHVSKLRPFLCSGRFPRAAAPLPAAIYLEDPAEGGGEWYSIDRILRHRVVGKRRGRRGRKEYLVKWSGYPEYEASWRAEKDVTEAAIAEYEARQDLA